MMTLSQYIVRQDFWKEKNTGNFQKEFEKAIKSYCEIKEFNLTNDDLNYISLMEMYPFYIGIREEYEKSIVSKKPAITYKVYDEDLLDAMWETNIPITQESLCEFKEYLSKSYDLNLETWKAKMRDDLSLYASGFKATLQT